MLEQRLEEFERRQIENMRISDEARRVREVQFTHKIKRESRSNKSWKHYRKNKTHKRTSSKTPPQSAASLVTSHTVTRLAAWLQLSSAGASRAIESVCKATTTSTPSLPRLIVQKQNDTNTAPARIGSPSRVTKKVGAQSKHQQCTLSRILPNNIPRIKKKKRSHIKEPTSLHFIIEPASSLIVEHAK